MTKPDKWDYLAAELLENLESPSGMNGPIDEIANALREAYAAGLERAAEIADEWQMQLEGQCNHAGCVATSIRAEKDLPDVTP
jgi:hypothetical protein